MRTFKEVTDDLGAAMDDAIGKKKNVEKVTAQADEMAKKAGEMKANANREFSDAQNKVVELRREYDVLMNSIVPMNQQSNVRQSG